MPPLVAAAASHMLCFRRLLVIMKSKNNPQYTFLEACRGIWLKKRAQKNPAIGNHFSMDSLEWGTRGGKERNPRSSLVWIKGLRKYVSMEVNCSQWETCDLQSGKVHWGESRPTLFTRERCDHEAPQKPAGCLLLFVLQMARPGLRGQSDNHMYKHTSRPEWRFGDPPAWLCR